MMEKAKPSIITICGDPGGARAILPVIKKLTTDNNTRLINYAYNEGNTIFKSENISCQDLPGSVSTNFIEEVYQEKTPSLIFTATSFNKVNWEKHFIFVAKRFKIFSMSILDYWSNYILRFGDENNELIFLPDKIGVMDNGARSDMVNLGFPSDKIIVTGQPALDSLQEDCMQFSSGRKKIIRKLYNVTENSIFIVFISQPLKTVFGKVGDPYYLGFDEQIVLKSLIDALEIISVHNNKAIDLLIRPHPREKKSDYVHYQSNKISIRVSEDSDTRECMMSADLVTGMNSIALVEACYLGCEVVSLQPGLCKPDSLVTNKTRESTAIYNLNDIQTMIESILFNKRRNVLKRSSREKSIQNNATHTIIMNLYRYLKINNT